MPKRTCDDYLLERINFLKGKCDLVDEDDFYAKRHMPREVIYEHRTTVENTKLVISWGKGRFVFSSCSARLA